MFATSSLLLFTPYLFPAARVSKNSFPKSGNISILQNIQNFQMHIKICFFFYRVFLPFSLGTIKNATKKRVKFSSVKGSEGKRKSKASLSEAQMLPPQPQSELSHLIRPVHDPALPSERPVVQADDSALPPERPMTPAVDLNVHDQSTSSNPERDRIRLAVAQSRRKHLKDLTLAALSYLPNVPCNNCKAVLIGSMNKECQHCKALKWDKESAGICCSSGKVSLPEIVPPDELRTLTDPDPSVPSQVEDSKHFLSNARKYNTALAITSFGASRQINNEPGIGYIPTFKIQGQVYHRAGSLLPPDGEDPKFLQIFFLGNPDQEVRERSKHQSGLKEFILLTLQEMIHKEHPLVKSFKTALEQMTSYDMKVIIHADKTPVGQHERRFNAPTVDEVAIPLAGDQTKPRDIVLCKRDSGLKRIHELNQSYDCLQYPLLFAKGEFGYSIDLKQVDPTNSGEHSNKNLSAKDFYAYRIMFRQGSCNHLLKCKQLFNQFLTDMHAKIESERLSFLRIHQKQIRAEEYKVLKDAMSVDGDPANLGKLTILPSSFTCSPRWYNQKEQDAMTYVRMYGTPDLFLTFTCNPHWKEIQDELFQGQVASDRYDIISRVFHLKHNKLMELLTKGQVFGPHKCFIYSIEWQKRGLPHSHTLL